MANMSYCRFSNTLGDLLDCYEHINDGGLSEDEAKARRQLIGTCRDIIDAVFSGNEEEEAEAH